MRVMEPPIENIPVLMIQDPLAAAGAVVLDCRPAVLPVSMDMSGMDDSGSGGVGRCGRASPRTSAVVRWGRLAGINLSGVGWNRC